MRNILQYIESKDSQLCIGLDPRVPKEEKVSKMKKIIDQTSDLCSAYKLNRQFWLNIPNNEIKQIVNMVHQKGCAAIIDHKLSDIGSSNKAAISHMIEEGFDYYTFSPFPGNSQEHGKFTEDTTISPISLVLMSNPSAEWMVKSQMYQTWAKQANSYCDGVVIGTTGHVTETIINQLAEILTDCFVLAPGIGSQGGEIHHLINGFGKRIIFNVSRGISLADDHRQAAIKYNQKINDLSE